MSAGPSTGGTATSAGAPPRSATDAGVPVGSVREGRVSDTSPPDASTLDISPPDACGRDVSVPGVRSASCWPAGCSRPGTAAASRCRSGMAAGVAGNGLVLTESLVGCAESAERSSPCRAGAGVGAGAGSCAVGNSFPTGCSIPCGPSMTCVTSPPLISCQHVRARTSDELRGVWTTIRDYQNIRENTSRSSTAFNQKLTEPPGFPTFPTALPTFATHAPHSWPRRRQVSPSSDIARLV